tara:strand:- start:64 stop:690 length:627 start_codon:yes stop_codon:yes gene_type:complete
MKKTIINNLFSTPVYSTAINRNFTKKEIDFVRDQKNYCSNNAGNTHTIDSYILNKPELKKIKKFLDDCCKDYLKTIICPQNNIELYITQSWLNYTEENQHHHMHEHPNSIVSGVLYFDSDKNNDKIKFFSQSKYKPISIKIDETKFNTWNSDSWWFAVETGQLLMFPSSTTHKVDVKKGSNTRISLSFNTFYKGTLGSNKDLTELILP